ncbi:MAG: tetratricopeptide repeat protein [Chloroflexi bacterium]|nr:tetratricopeptide repeat protein [Chloroflexota bacterium]
MTFLFSWTTFAIVAVALALILLALRLFHRLRFTIRFRGAVSVSPWSEQPCPHLGLVDEPFIHRDEPSEEHRCYLWMQRDRIDLTHQKGFCLSSAHAHCPWLSIAPPEGEAPATGRLATPVGAAAIHGAASSLEWLRPRLKESLAAGRQKAAAGLPVLAALALALAKAAARGAGVAALAIWRAAKTAAGDLYGRRRGSAAPAGGSVAASATPASREPSSLPEPALAPGATVKIPLAAPAGTVSSHVESLVEQGKAASSGGDRKLAYTLFSLALDLEPKNDEVWLWKGASAEGEEEKVACFQQALAINPSSLRAQQALNQLTQTYWNSQIASREPSVLPYQTEGLSAEALMEAAVSALGKGDEDRAYRFSVSATEANPRSEKAWFWRAKTAGSLDEVIFSLNQALTINPDNEKVKANLLWAIQRQQKEERPSQPQTAAPAPAAQFAEVARPARRIRATGFRWLASMLCLVMAGYWVAAALQPLFDILNLGKFFVEALPAGLGSDLANGLAEGLERWLPSLNWSSLPNHRDFELSSGYSLFAALPYTIGFLFLFVGIGLLRQERWSLVWGLVATASSLGLGLFFSTNGRGSGLVIALGLVIAVGLFLGRAGRKKAAPEPLVQYKPIDSPYHPVR